MFRRVFSGIFALMLTCGLTGCRTPVGPEASSEPSAQAGSTIPLDPAVIATVSTNDSVVEATTVDEMINAIDKSGKSQITLWQDIRYTTALRLPYSCTLDYNGFSIHTSENAGNGLHILEAGTENPITTLKNGTQLQYGVGIQVEQGGIVLDQMTIHSTGGTPLGLLDTDSAYKSVNCVKNSTLTSGGWACVAFYKNGEDYSETGISIENSTLISYDANGSNLFGKIGSDTAPGNIYLGENVDLYSYSAFLSDEGFYYSGSLALKSDEPVSAEVNGTILPAMTHWSTENEKDCLNLLMIGNSFCYYYVQELYGIATAAGVNINITNLYEAGCYVEEHWNWLTNPASGADRYQYWITNDMGRYKHGDITASYDALKYLDWDVITLQQHFGSGIKDYDAAMEKCVPYVKDLYDYLKENHPQAKLYWQETWAYQVGHESMPSVSDQSYRQDNIIKASKALAEENGVSLIPSGHAWKIARADPLVGDRLCRSDFYHDGDIGGGQYLNACVWFEVLTGKSCIGNTWRPNYQLSEEKIIQLQKAAHQAVAEVYGADYTG